MIRMISMRDLERYLDRKAEKRNARSGYDGWVLLDVRSPSEFAEGHLRGAVNIPLEELEQRYRELREASEIFVYCEHGNRSLLAVRFLDRMGFRAAAAAGGLSGYRGKHYESI